jgi:hypothetical protein
MLGAPPSPVPGWAKTLSADDLQRFLGLVTGYFAERGIAYDLDAEMGTLSPDIRVLSRSSVFGLQNIAQACAHASPERWDGLIASHFDCLFTPADDENALRVDLSDYTHVQRRLRSRLYPTSLLYQTDSVLYQEYAAGIIETLVIDLPSSVRSVSQVEARGWGIPDSELFMTGRRNLAFSRFLEETRFPVHGTWLHSFTGDSFYAASHLLTFERYITQPMPHGLLVSVPKRDIILAHYIHDAGVMDAIGAMLQVTTDMHTEGPGSLSPNLYWYRNGGLTTIDYEMTHHSFTLNPTPEFRGILQHMAERVALQ